MTSRPISARPRMATKVSLVTTKGGTGMNGPRARVGSRETSDDDGDANPERRAMRTASGPVTKLDHAQNRKNRKKKRPSLMAKRMQAFPSSSSSGPRGESGARQPSDPDWMDNPIQGRFASNQTSAGVSSKPSKQGGPSSQVRAVPSFAASSGDETDPEGLRTGSNGALSLMRASSGSERGMNFRFDLTAACSDTPGLFCCWFPRFRRYMIDKVDFRDPAISKAFKAYRAESTYKTTRGWITTFGTTVCIVLLIACGYVALRFPLQFERRGLWPNATYCAACDTAVIARRTLAEQREALHEPCACVACPWVRTWIFVPVISAMVATGCLIVLVLLMYRPTYWTRRSFRDFLMPYLLVTVICETVTVISLFELWAEMENKHLLRLVLASSKERVKAETAHRQLAALNWSANATSQYEQLRAAEQAAAAGSAAAGAVGAANASVELLLDMIGGLAASSDLFGGAGLDPSSPASCPVKDCGNPRLKLDEWPLQDIITQKINRPFFFVIFGLTLLLNQISSAVMIGLRIGFKPMVYFMLWSMVYMLLYLPNTKVDPMVDGTAVYLSIIGRWTGPPSTSRSSGPSPSSSSSRSSSSASPGSCSARAASSFSSFTPWPTRTSPCDAPRSSPSCCRSPIPSSDRVAPGASLRRTTAG